MRFVCKFILLWACLPYAWAADTAPDNLLSLPKGDSPWRLHGDLNLIGQFHDSFPSLYENTPDQGGNSLQSAPERSQTTMLGLNLGYRYALFIGDGPKPNGPIRYGMEQVIEAYYLVGLSKQTHLTLDWQHITNPAYNPDRLDGTLALRFGSGYFN